MRRDYQPWTQAEDEQILSFRDRGYTLDQASAIMGRSMGAISSRLKYLRAGKDAVDNMTKDMLTDIRDLKDRQEQLETELIQIRADRTVEADAICNLISNAIGIINLAGRMPTAAECKLKRALRELKKL